jgi:hypothetical protein
MKRYFKYILIIFSFLFLFASNADARLYRHTRAQHMSGFWRLYQVDPSNLVAWYKQRDPRSSTGGSVWTDLSQYEGATDNTLTLVASPTLTTGRSGYWIFNGSTQYGVQTEQDDEQGALTYVGDAGSAEFRDASQDFSDWETTPASNAAYMIVTHSDNGVSWGYMGASNNSGKDIDIYSDLGLTTRGWKGRTTPNGSGDTPATYEIYRSDFNMTGDLTILIWLKPDDGQPADWEVVFSKWNTSDNTRSFAFDIWPAGGAHAGKIILYISDDGTNFFGERSDSAVFSDGAQTAFTFLGYVFDSSIPDGAQYVNGSVEASTIISGPYGSSRFDSPNPFSISRSDDLYHFAGAIAEVLIFSRALSLAEVGQLWKSFGGNRRRNLP